ncbi:MAG: hypothetical protein ACKVQK_30130 [Burkholderiales bacterium]
MTCEIAIMNQNAVALAADSAMTVRRWVNGERQTRYFKGSNKIFQISNYHPVGLMVFGSANVQQIAWELIVKEFRAHLKSTSFQSLNGYAEALFDYIRQHPMFFPAERRVNIFVDEVRNTALALLWNAKKALKLEIAPEDAEQGRKVTDEFWNEEIAKISKDPLPKACKGGADHQALTTHREKLEENIKGAVAWFKGKGEIHSGRDINYGLLTLLSVQTLYRKYQKLLGSSGIVIAGYGELDLYPAYHEMSVYGFLLDDFIYDDESQHAVSIDLPSVIKPFATTAMVDTFLLGFSQDVYLQVMTKYESSIKSLLDNVKKALKTTDIPQFDDLLKNAQSEYQEAWTNAVADDHWKPLREVVASLPVDEMANLAETLVMLQSLKEKVTSPTESVGGPIDVAVITRHEGLIWLKRKLYFDPQKNPRYFWRQQGIYR